MQITKVNLSDILPLTCSRTGTCCHGNFVLLNPWEIACLAHVKNITAKEFCNQYCDFGGIRLRFDGQLGVKGKKACRLYVANFGCSVHSVRPLACRLYPLGRQIQNNEIKYMYQGKTFPCFEGCKQVTELPRLSVEKYLQIQLTENYEKAQDEYLELMQNLADVAFMLLLDTSLVKSGETKTLQHWKKISVATPSELIEKMGTEWLEYLMFPKIDVTLGDSSFYIKKHGEMLLLKVQEKIDNLHTNQEYHDTSILMMSLALYLAYSVGANPQNIANHWIKTAKELGAKY